MVSGQGREHLPACVACQERRRIQLIGALAEDMPLVCPSVRECLAEPARPFRFLPNGL
jgi:hypothetical protein